MSLQSTCHPGALIWGPRGGPAPPRARFSPSGLGSWLWLSQASSGGPVETWKCLGLLSCFSHHEIFFPLVWPELKSQPVPIVWQALWGEDTQRRSGRGKFIRFSTLGTRHSLFPHLGPWLVCVCVCVCMCIEGGLASSKLPPGMAMSARLQHSQHASPCSWEWGGAARGERSQPQKHFLGLRKAQGLCDMLGGTGSAWTPVTDGSPCCHSGEVSTEHVAYYTREAEKDPQGGNSGVPGRRPFWKSTGE